MRITLIIILLLSYLRVQSQIVPEFITTLHFEDSFGNVDSMIIGYDPRIQSKMENTEFGERDIKDELWDMDFEVRGVRRLDATTQRNPVLSKRIFGTTNGYYSQTHNCSIFPTNVDILVRYTDLPIIVKWDKESFDNSWCRQSTYIAAHAGWITSPYWYLDTNWVAQASCMSKMDSLVITDFDVDGWGDTEEVILKNGENALVSVLRINFATLTTIDSPCALISSSIDHYIRPIKVFPNPTSDVIFWDSHSDMKFQLFSLNGESVTSGQGRKLDLSTFPNGTYILKIFDEGHEEIFVSNPIVKMD